MSQQCSSIWCLAGCLFGCLSSRGFLPLLFYEYIIGFSAKCGCVLLVVPLLIGLLSCLVSLDHKVVSRWFACMSRFEETGESCSWFHHTSFSAALRSFHSSLTSLPASGMLRPLRSPLAKRSAENRRYAPLGRLGARSS